MKEALIRSSEHNVPIHLHLETKEKTTIEYVKKAVKKSNVKGDLVAIHHHPAKQLEYNKK